MNHSKRINKFFPSVEQSIFTIIIDKFKELKTDLYSLPLFTVGLPYENQIKSVCVVHPIHCNKELSMKERLLYYNNEDYYYTSTKNHYIIAKREILQSNFSIIINFIKTNNLILILPDQICTIPHCFHSMKIYFGDQLLIEELQKNNIEYRESTFLRHPLVPSKFKVIKSISINSLFSINLTLYCSICVTK